MKLKTRIHQILEAAEKTDRSSQIFDYFILTLILLNVFSIVLESVSSIRINYFQFFRYFELFSVVIFSIEYLLRIYSCTADKRFRGLIVGRIKFAFTPLAIIDFLAVLPFFLPFIVALDLRFIRALRLLRIFRILKFSRYIKAMNTFHKVFKEKKEELFITFTFVIVLLLVASSLIYFIENKAQPEIFSSIPMAMWWGVSALTTVGYGDIYPITVLGKILGAVISFLGIGIFALPAGVLASGLIKVLEKDAGKCSHCKINKDKGDKGAGAKYPEQIEMIV